MAKREALELPEGFADPGLPTGTFSHSQYSTYKKCGRAYEFQYVRRETKPSNGAMRRGVLIHKGVEHALRHKMQTGSLPTVDASLAAVREEHESYTEEVDWGDEPVTEVLSRTERALRTYYAHGLRTVNPIAVEQALVFKAGDVPIIGYIDFVDQPIGDPMAWVVDLKTSAKKWSASQVASNTQLTLYALGTGTTNVRIDNLVLKELSVEFQREEHVRSRRQLQVLTEDLQEVASDIKKGRFPMTAIDSWACNETWCPYWHQCRGRKS